MEELAYVAGKIVKGIAGLAYVFGDGLLEAAATDDRGKKGKGEDGADEER
ncbi:hypothetical protein [Streptomyces sp. NPDC048606]